MDAVIEFARKLIKVQSITGNSKKAEEILSLVKHELQDFEPQLYSQQGIESLLYSNKGSTSKKFKIILNAHLDVVPGNTDQFEPYIKDGKLYARGSYDMKTAAAVMIILFKNIADKLNYPLALQLVTDEEVVSGLGTKMQLQKGIAAEFAVIGECGSNFDIIYENKGIIHAKITTVGITAHGAYPWRGENAIMKMHEVIQKIHQHFPNPKSETFETTVSISQITTPNDMWNQVPDKCIATLDIRTPREQSKTILAEIKSLLPEDVLIDIVKTRTPHYTNPNNKYVTLLNSAGKQITGTDLQKRKTFGGSDATFFSEMGFDAVEFGPVGGGQHDDNEWVDIKTLADYYQVLKQFLFSVT